MTSETATFENDIPDRVADESRTRRKSERNKQILGVSQSLGTRLYYIVVNLLRWVVLGVTLVFLLAAILALYEALNFQGRVLELANNDSDRASRFNRPTGSGFLMPARYDGFIYNVALPISPEDSN